MWGEARGQGFGVPTSALPPADWFFLDKALMFSEPQFCHLENGERD